MPFFCSSMALYITSLNSGSNGNCYYVGNDTEAILVDAGISCRETEKRMNRLGLSMSSVKAIFVSHEHTDHIRGIPVLAAKYLLPVYITSKTKHACNFVLGDHPVETFNAHQPVVIGTLTVTAFPKIHDAIEPHSFIVSHSNVTVGIFTDIGAPCDHLKQHFSKCHAAFLEANYDEDMLHNGRYPYHLKRRISGGQGHLSNKEALEFFIAHKPRHFSCLLLSHLSSENNKPEIVEALFNEHAKGVEIVVASRYKETAVYKIDPQLNFQRPQKTVSIQKNTLQLSMF
jgi:phosphoribosyl 1,2-cyclic phosphodiesterase